MGRKNILYTFPMFDAASAGADATSAVVPVATLDKASIYLSWTGSPVGVLAVQVRNGAGETWYDIDMGDTISIDGSATYHQLIFNELPFTDMRLFYDRTSGTGTISAIITSKQIGG